METNNNKESYRSTFGILFYLNTSKRKKSGECPIMVRITIDGKSTTMSVGVEALPEKWDTKSTMVIGNGKEVSAINRQIEQLKEKIDVAYKRLVHVEGFVTAEALRNVIRGQGSGVEQNTLMCEYAVLIAEREQSKGITLSVRACAACINASHHVKDFLQSKYDVEDLPFTKVDYQLIEDFDYYLKVTLQMKPKTVHNIMSYLKITIKRAIHKGWLHQNPFLDYVPEHSIAERKWLSADEINRLLNVPVNGKLEFVRDIIAFSLFTGISYSDIVGLKQSNFERQGDGSLWIILDRQKTGTPSYIPLLPIPQQILDKYKDSPYTGWGGRIFRMPSLAHINIHLKEFAKQAGITRNISFHACRHSFATLCLTEGVPIETLSRVLGHKNITTTQIYGKITRTKLNEDMDNLAQRIDGMFELK